MAKISKLKIDKELAKYDKSFLSKKLSALRKSELLSLPDWDELTDYSLIELKVLMKDMITDLKLKRGATVKDYVIADIKSKYNPVSVPPAPKPTKRYVESEEFIKRSTAKLIKEMKTKKLKRSGSTEHLINDVIDEFKKPKSNSKHILSAFTDAKLERLKNKQKQRKYEEEIKLLEESFSSALMLGEPKDITKFNQTIKFANQITPEIYNKDEKGTEPAMY